MSLTKPDLTFSIFRHYGRSVYAEVLGGKSTPVTRLPLGVEARSPASPSRSEDNDLI